MKDLFQRGLIKQTTSDRLRDPADPLTFYVGFDPTADSLHVGHLLQLVTVRRLVRLGHRPIILIGDATARIGDPSGKRSARPMLSAEEIDANAMAIEAQIRTLVTGATFVRNKAWTDQTTFLDFATTIGSCFSVNVMLRADCFKARLEDGLSFLELSYMLMQAGDFLHLHATKGCTLQVGGDDQWSNILAGVDLIRRKARQEAFGLTLPLLVNSDGTKMGKTEKGAVWLSPARTSVFDFFQFWRNIPDDKVLECLRFLSEAPIDEIEAVSSDVPAINAAKKRLAAELTALVHGADEAAKAQDQAERVFEAGDASSLETVTIWDGAELVEVLKVCGLAKSRTDARNLILGRGVFINDIVIVDPGFKIESASLGAEPVLRKGKKAHKRLKVVGG